MNLKSRLAQSISGWTILPESLASIGSWAVGQGEGHGCLRAPQELAEEIRATGQGRRAALRAVTDGVLAAAPDALRRQGKLLVQPSGPRLVAEHLLVEFVSPTDDHGRHAGV